MAPYILKNSIDDGQFPADAEDVVVQLPDVQQLPASLHWGDVSTSLRRLDLSACSSLRHLPAGLFSSLTSLQSLELGGNNTDWGPACRQLEVLPAAIGALTALQHLNLRGCSSLKQLPESLGSLGRLQLLDLSGCVSLQQLPSRLGCCTALQCLSLAGCCSLRGLPQSLGSCRQLQQLDIRGCSSLRHLPSSCSRLRALQRFCFEGCPACAGLSNSNGTSVPGDTLTPHTPWVTPSQSQRTPAQQAGRGQQQQSNMSSSHQSTPASAAAAAGAEPVNSTDSLQLYSGPQPATAPAAAAAAAGDGGGQGYKLVRSALSLQRYRNAVVKLATQQEPMLTTLERMSWLVVLLATATFVAFTMPPGGYGDNQQVLSSSRGACARGSEHGVDADGVSTPAFQQCSMLLFFVFDGLSFGLSLGCVMMIVVLSMPRIQWESEKAEAGRFYLLLSFTWFLLYAAVATGFASFIAAGLSVNRQVKVVIGPVVPGMVLLLVGGVLLCYRFWCLAPGWDAVRASLSFHNQEVKDVCEVERGQELFWRYWSSRLGGGSSSGSSSAAGGVEYGPLGVGGEQPVDLEMQRLLPPPALPQAPRGAAPAWSTGSAAMGRVDAGRPSC